MELSHNKAKPTILHLIASLDVGGTERQLRLTSTRLTDFNHTIVCLQKWGSVGEELRALGFSVFFVPTPSFFTLHSVHDFGNIIKTTKPDIMVTYLPFADIFGRIWGKRYGVPKIVCFLRSTMRDWRHFPLVLLNIATQRLVDRFFSVSGATKEFYESWGLREGMTDVISNGIEIKKEERAESPIARLSQNVVIGYIARFRKERGHALLFKAFKIIKRKTANVRLMLVGDGPLRLRLEGKARRLGLDGEIIFLGHQADSRRLFSTFTIYCHPSLYEGMSNALLEAMAAGCPIVTTDIPENRELLTDRESALLVPPKNSSRLAEAVLYLVNNPGARSKLGNKAKEEAGRFDINKTARRLNYLLHELLS